VTVDSPSANDTIAAVATPAGRGGVGIVRVSGPAVETIAAAVLGRLPAPRHARYARFLDADGETLDEGLALYFPAPASFTGEPVLELHGHGGPVVLDLVLARLLALGARAARPGEFSQRAYLNDKMDLAQAEAIADLIDSASAKAARAALHSLQGVFSEQVHALVESLIQLRVYVEAAIDFPDEEGIDFLADTELVRRLDGVNATLGALRENAHQGQLLRDGMRVVIAGRPNAGKSSLLNRLAGRDAAIVTHVPGTTRDVLREHIQLDGMPLHVIDTAGLRDGADLVEQEGIRRAWAEIENADRVLVVVDDTLGVDDAVEAILSRLPPGVPRTLILNKADLSGRPTTLETTDWGPAVRLSARTGDGLDRLRSHLESCMGYESGGEGLFMARRRHLQALDQASDCLTRAERQIRDARAGELAAEELRLAQQALGEITGAFTSDDLLGRIFASFCIGK
jgi:tRNA modification GTPase